MEELIPHDLEILTPEQEDVQEIVDDFIDYYQEAVNRLLERFVDQAT